jgi:hypothetical protein
MFFQCTTRRDRHSATAAEEIKQKLRVLDGSLAKLEARATQLHDEERATDRQVRLDNKAVLTDDTNSKRIADQTELRKETQEAKDSRALELLVVHKSTLRTQEAGQLLSLIAKVPGVHLHGRRYAMREQSRSSKDSLDADAIANEMAEVATRVAPDANAVRASSTKASSAARAGAADAVIALLVKCMDGCPPGTQTCNTLIAKCKQSAKVAYQRSGLTDMDEFDRVFFQASATVRIQQLKLQQFDVTYHNGIVAVKQCLKVNTDFDYKEECAKRVRGSFSRVGGIDSAMLANLMHQAEGTGCPKGNVLENQVCTPCSAGKYSRGTSGDGRCSACPVGQYTPDEGSWSCSACPTGKYARGGVHCQSCSSNPKACPLWRPVVPPPAVAAATRQTPSGQSLAAPKRAAKQPAPAPHRHHQLLSGNFAAGIAIAAGIVIAVVYELLAKPAVEPEMAFQNPDFWQQAATTATYGGAE